MAAKQKGAVSCWQVFARTECQAHFAIWDKGVKRTYVYNGIPILHQRY